MRRIWIGVAVLLVAFAWWATMPSASGWWRQYAIDAKTDSCPERHAEATHADLAGCIICTKADLAKAQAEVSRLTAALRGKP